MGMCSAPFIGGRQLPDPGFLSYTPTIFPLTQRKTPGIAEDRYSSCKLPVCYLYLRFIIYHICTILTYPQFTTCRKVYFKKFRKKIVLVGLHSIFGGVCVHENDAGRFEADFGVGPDRNAHTNFKVVQLMTSWSKPTCWSAHMWLKYITSVRKYINKKDILV